MSHTCNIKVEMHDIAALQAACQRLGLSIVDGKHKLFASTEKGLAIRLPDWRYPIVIKSDGNIAYDNYNGKWGDIEELNKLKAVYALEKAKIEARKRGFSFYESFNEAEQKFVLKIKVGG